MTHDSPATQPAGEAAPSRRRSTAALGARVLFVQAVTLLALWLLQQAFGGG